MTGRTMAYVFEQRRTGDIIRLITDYPEFKVIYDEVYNLCLNVEKVMEMFSKELKELDQRTGRKIESFYKRNGVKM